jgi:hypothetical protein
MHFLVCQMQGEIAHAQIQRRFFRKPAAKRTHPGHQFLHRKWLCQVVIGSELETGHAIIQFASSCKHQNAVRHLFGAHPFQNFEAIDSRQPDIEDDQVEWRSLCFPERGFAIVDHDGIVACFRESGGDVASEADLIVYYQYAHSFIRREQVLPPSTNRGDGLGCAAAS